MEKIPNKTFEKTHPHIHKYVVLCIWTAIIIKCKYRTFFRGAMKPAKAQLTSTFPSPPRISSAFASIIRLHLQPIVIRAAYERQKRKKILRKGAKKVYQACIGCVGVMMMFHAILICIYILLMSHTRTSTLNAKNSNERGCATFEFEPIFIRSAASAIYVRAMTNIATSSICNTIHVIEKNRKFVRTRKHIQRHIRMIKRSIWK